MPTTYNTILLDKKVPKHLERLAAGAITPGHILYLTSADKFAVHNVAGGDVTPVIVAVEDDLQGRGIDDAYAATGSYTRVQAEVLDPGDQFYGFLADGQNAAIGSKLKSNGNGQLSVYTAASGEPDYGRAVCAVALEAIDRSSSSGGDTNTTGRIRCMAV